MTRVGSLGLGRMGAPIARRLAEAGFDVTTHDPRHPGPSAEQVAAQAEVLVTVLPGSAEFVSSASALLSALPPGALWIDLTTTDPRAAELVSASASDRGIDFVAAPMSGTPGNAEAGTLRFLVGGASVDRARPVLEPLGTVDHVGTPGEACTTKLIANLLWFGQVVAASEALLLARSQGLDAPALLTRLQAGPAASTFLRDYGDALVTGDDATHFGVDRIVEELEILASLARAGDIPFELSSLVTRLHREALERYGPVEGELIVSRLLGERYRSSRD